MVPDTTLVAQIEALTRSEFRAAVNEERRATLAIGALVFSWGQFDSRMGWMIKELKGLHERLGSSALSGEHPNNQAGQLRLLRTFIQASATTTAPLREFDRLRSRISAATAARDDVVHGALGLGSSTGTVEGIYLLCVPSRKAKRTNEGIVPARHDFVFHLLSHIFQAADHLREDLGALESLVDSATGTFAPGKDGPNEG